MQFILRHALLDWNQLVVLCQLLEYYVWSKDAKSSGMINEHSHDCHVLLNAHLRLFRQLVQAFPRPNADINRKGNTQIQEVWNNFFEAGVGVSKSSWCCQCLEMMNHWKTSCQTANPSSSVLLFTSVFAWLCHQALSVGSAHQKEILL